MSKLSQILLDLVLVVVVAVGSFFGGMVFGKGQSQTTASAQGTAAQARGATQPYGQAAPGAQGAGRQGGGMLAGTIQDIGNGVMTVTDSTGKHTQIKVTDTTLIQKQASVTLSALAKGEAVMVSGTQGSDSVLTARTVQVVTAAALGTIPTDATDTANPAQGTMPFNPGQGFPGQGNTFPGVRPNP